MTWRMFYMLFSGMSAASGRRQIAELKPVAEERSLLDVIF